MLDFIRVFSRGIMNIVNMLDNVQLFDTVSLFDFFIGAVVICIIISVFWKGVGT